MYDWGTFRVLVYYIFINYNVIIGFNTNSMNDRGTEGERASETTPYSGNDKALFQIGESVVIRQSLITYVTFVSIGITLLWPWNCFLSATVYYDERFSNSPHLAKIYSSSMMAIFTVTSLVYNYYLSKIQEGVDYRNRLVKGFIITFFTFLIMAFSCVMKFFVKMNDVVYFTGLMFMVVVSSISTSLSQNGAMATANLHGSLYANGVVVGQGIAGVLPALSLIISILLAGEKTTAHANSNKKDYSVFIYYTTACLVSAISLVLVRFLRSKSPSENHYYPLGDSESIERNEASESVFAEERQVSFVGYDVLWSKLKFIVMSIFGAFSVSLVFPVFASKVESVHTNSSNIFFEKRMFVPVVFLMWNLGDLVGRVLCGVARSKFLIEDKQKLIKYTIYRIIFIFLLLTCNWNSRDGVNAALIKSDTWYILVQFLFGLTNGHLCASSFMIVGDNCDTDDEKEAASGFTTVFLSLGLVAGSIVSFFFTFFL